MEPTRKNVSEACELILTTFVTYLDDSQTAGTKRAQEAALIIARFAVGVGGAEDTLEQLDLVIAAMEKQIVIHEGLASVEMALGKIRACRELVACCPF